MTLDILLDQVHSLRMRHLVEELKKGTRAGAFWGIGTPIGDYQLQAHGKQPAIDGALTSSLCRIRTRLNAFTPEEQGRLINWGYALTDAGEALRNERGPRARPMAGTRICPVGKREKGQRSWTPWTEKTPTSSFSRASLYCKTGKSGRGGGTDRSEGHAEARADFPPANPPMIYHPTSRPTAAGRYLSP